ncbi:hypothetical protein CR51_18655 [Caballeronia megalochromosomata]|nr:hypothetical protein CR51_18655 [Caballeronia megalochromosomata]
MSALLQYRAQYRLCAFAGCAAELRLKEWDVLEEAFCFLVIRGIARLPLTGAMVDVDGAAYSVVLLGLGLCTSVTFDAGLSRTFAASVVWGIANAPGIDGRSVRAS